MPTSNSPLIIAITGASGAMLAERFIHAVLTHTPWTIHLIITNAGQQVWTHELQPLPLPTSERITQHHILDLNAPIASGSFHTRGMVIIPCSMGSMAKIANGIADSLLTRAADVTIKENRQLLIVPRESPLSQIHLTNMLTLAKCGARIVPPMLSLYHHPETIQDMANQFALRLLAMLNVATPLKRWGC